MSRFKCIGTGLVSTEPNEHLRALLGTEPNAAEVPRRYQTPLMARVDSSVWIRALAGKGPYRGKLDELLAAEQVIGHELVYGERVAGR